MVTKLSVKGSSECGQHFGSNYHFKVKDDKMRTIIKITNLHCGSSLWWHNFTKHLLIPLLGYT